MRWKNVKLIFHRELRDQLRDRRTLFMIAVLPLLLYPLMGMALLQIAQLRQVQPTKVWLIGSSHLPDRPVLLEDGQIVASLFSSPDRAHLIDLDVAESLPEGAESIEKLASEVLAEKLYDAVVYFPPTFATEIEKNLSVEDVRFVPRPQVFFSGAREKSRTAYDRIVLLLDRWRGEIVQRTLAARQIPPSAAEPFEIGDQDVAEETKIRAALWSKVLPFIVIVWALTGAFYPAIDLCAGEKERGTLETLLSSPAERLEIVWGKLLTVMLFSIATSILNVISVTLPPLRERREDLPLLITHFLERFNRENEKAVQQLAPDVMERFLTYRWPGNVRELENMIKRMVVLGSEQTVLQELRQKEAPSVSAADEEDVDLAALGADFATGQELDLKAISKRASQIAEKKVIERVLGLTRWNRKEAAERLQISYKALLYKMKENGLSEGR